MRTRTLAASNNVCTCLSRKFNRFSSSCILYNNEEVCVLPLTACFPAWSARLLSPSNISNKVRYDERSFSKVANASRPRSEVKSVVSLLLSDSNRPFGIFRMPCKLRDSNRSYKALTCSFSFFKVPTSKVAASRDASRSANVNRMRRNIVVTAESSSSSLSSSSRSFAAAARRSANFLAASASSSSSTFLLALALLSSSIASISASPQPALLGLSLPIILSSTALRISSLSAFACLKLSSASSLAALLASCSALSLPSRSTLAASATSSRLLNSIALSSALICSGLGC